MLKVSRGKMPRPQKVVIYGSEGIGKTTFASKFPEPLFVDTEGGTSHMDVLRVEPPKTWIELLNIVDEVAVDKEICKTLVIDTADWAEAMCVEHVCLINKKTSIEGFGYGKGYVVLAEEFGKLLKGLDKVIESGKNVVVTAHAKMRKFEQPDEQGAYDRWEMKLTRQVAPLLKEWCDMLLFLNYKTYVITTENDTKKAQGGKRVIYTSHHPCWDAKNRHGLAPELELDFREIAHIFENVEPQKVEMSEPQQTPLEKVLALMIKDDVIETQVQKVVSDKGHYAPDVPISEYSDKFISGWLIKYWPKILELINKQSQAE